MQVVVGDEQLNIDFRRPFVGHSPGYLAIGEKAGTEQPSWDDYVDLLMQQWCSLKVIPLTIAGRGRLSTLGPRMTTPSWSFGDSREAADGRRAGGVMVWRVCLA
ncbi:MAG: hypothetical protein ACTHKL_31485 [Streptosporangiaceae bacterium]